MQSIDELFSRAEKWGVYIFLDLHQDLYGSYDRDGCGDGAPKWAYLSEPYEPKPAKFVWAEGYFWGKAVHRAFDNFWDNKPVEGRGVQDRFADLWSILASRYGNSKVLLGFDLLNEPFPGKVGGKIFRKLISSLVRNILFNRKISRTKLLGDLIVKSRRDFLLDNLHGDFIKDVSKPVHKLCAAFDKERYEPFLERMTKAVRKESSDGIVMFEHCYYGNLGIPLAIDPIKVDGKEDKLQCYSPHAYDFMVDTPAYQYASDSRLDAFFSAARESQKRLNVPVMVGEWGGGQERVSHVNFLLDMFDEYQWSQAYYCHSYFNEELLSALCRTYPVAVSGEIESFGMDREKNVFNLSFVHTENVKGDTILYLHKEPKSIETDGVVTQYTENGGHYAKIKTTKGKRTVTVKY